MHARHQFFVIDSFRGAAFPILSSAVSAIADMLGTNMLKPILVHFLSLVWLVLWIRVELAQRKFKRIRFDPEARHLARHPAEPCAGANDDCVIVFEFVDSRDFGLLVELEMRCLCNFKRRGFWNAADGDVCPGVTRAFGDSFGHGFKVAVAGLIKNKDFSHGNFLCVGKGFNHLVIPSLFRDNTPPSPVILKQVQDDEAWWFAALLTPNRPRRFRRPQSR